MNPYHPDFRRWLAINRPGASILAYRLPKSRNASRYRAALEAAEASISEIRAFERDWKAYDKARVWWVNPCNEE